MKSLERVFAPEGPLAAAIPGYRRRSGQMEMSEAIAATIESTGVLVAEAGTGTGKPFAYLVPALLAGGKVIVSTGTKTLQDQLFDRDLPAVREALTSGASIALLKGRSNYVCLYRLRRAATEGGASTREEASQLQRIQRFAALTTTGDRADLPDVPEDAPIWSQATSTRDNCLGQGCPDYADCFVMRARRNALAADIVVINHHLFFADVVLRDEGVAELLPACNTLIFDEAHQLPETARLFLDRKSTRLNSSHTVISYAVFCLKKKKNTTELHSHSDIAYLLLLNTTRAHSSDSGEPDATVHCSCYRHIACDHLALLRSHTSRD